MSAAKLNKRLVAVFYKTAAGAEPVREWLKELSKDDRVRIGGDIQAIEFLWPEVKAPLVKSLGKGLWEVRVDLANRIARVFFAPVAGNMVLLHRIIKKDQQTRKQDIDKARDRLKEVLK